jgi:hypothetical protein
MTFLKKTFQIGTATLLAWTVAGIASAQVVATSTPGTPDTGAGGEMVTNLVVLAIAAIIVVAGVAFFSNRSAKA